MGETPHAPTQSLRVAFPLRFCGKTNLIQLGKTQQSVNLLAESRRSNREKMRREQTNRHGLSNPAVQQRLDWSLASIDGGQLGPGCEREARCRCIYLSKVSNTLHYGRMRSKRALKINSARGEKTKGFKPVLSK